MIINIMIINYNVKILKDAFIKIGDAQLLI